jgi:hypothetical protein
MPCHVNGRNVRCVFSKYLDLCSNEIYLWFRPSYSWDMCNGSMYRDCREEMARNYQHCQFHLLHSGFLITSSDSISMSNDIMEVLISLDVDSFAMLCCSSPLFRSRVSKVCVFLRRFQFYTNKQVNAHLSKHLTIIILKGNYSN